MEKKRKKIAIIGGGVAGLTAFWRLSEIHDATLYEKDRVVGGHAQTVPVEIPNGVVYADLAVQLFSDQIYPNLFAFFKTHEILSSLTPLTFAAHFPRESDYWNNEALHKTKLGERLRQECDRFHAEMQFLPNNAKEKVAPLTLGQFLQEANFSEEFVEKALKPMFSVLAGTRASFKEFSLLYCMVLFNCGLLSFFSPPQWRRLDYGAFSHIDFLAKEGASRGSMNCNTEVIQVLRQDGKVQIVYGEKHKEIFDEVIFATSAGVALQLLEYPTIEERQMLGKFEYHGVISILHTDPNFLSFLPEQPKDFGNLPTCIYSLDENSTNQMGTTTFVVNSYTRRNGIPFPILVSIDPKTEISSKHIIAKRKFQLPKLRPADLEMKKQIGAIQGQNHTWFCGLDSSTTGHESSFVSGLVISEALGADYPYEDFLSAKSFYENTKKIMGIQLDKAEILSHK